MPLAISNLSFPLDIGGQTLLDLRSRGVEGVEVAPTRLCHWSEINNSTLSLYRTKLSDAGLCIPSLQSLLFGTQGLQLLADEQSFSAMTEHLRFVANIGLRLGAKVGVLGSPRNRLRGALSNEAAWEVGRVRLRRLASISLAEGFTIALEPVPAHYGGDFLTTATEVIQMVREVNEPGLCVHLDTGCVMLGGGDISSAILEASILLGHFHVAEPELGPFHSPVCAHAETAIALAEINYSRWIAIEMREQSPHPVEEIILATDFIMKTYKLEKQSKA